MAAVHDAIAAARRPDATDQDKAWADWLLWLAREPGETTATEVLARIEGYDI